MDLAGFEPGSLAWESNILYKEKSLSWHYLPRPIPVPWIQNKEVKSFLKLWSDQTFWDLKIDKNRLQGGVVHLLFSEHICILYIPIYCWKMMTFLCFNIVATKHGIACCLYRMLLCWHFMQTFWDFTTKLSLSWYVIFLELRFSLQTKK